MNGIQEAGQNRWTAPKPAVCTAGLVCDCGQDLDCCSGSHCPRCGTSVDRCASDQHLERGPLGWVA